MILGVVKVFEHWDSRQPRGDEEHSEAADPENDQG
jgi:hypothetical protein